MSARAKRRQGYGKLLDAWESPEGAGEAVGCLTTTFTFDPAFFEEECLGRFLGLESDPVSDGSLYLIEREEKMAQLECAGVLADAHHCQGVRSLRWDLIPALVNGGVQHAKLSLLVWSKLIRLVVASANLTPDGYRRNLEVFGVLDYHQGSQMELACLEGAVAFLRHALRSALPGGSGSPALTRWQALLDRLGNTPADWGLDRERASRLATRTALVGLGPWSRSVLDQIQQLWPSGGPPTRAVVLSPFFDPPEAENRPARELWNRLRQRGPAQVEYLLTVEEVPGENALFLHAPESLLAAQPAGRPVGTTLKKLELDRARPLHAKGLWLENDRWALYLVGSSNFTSPGLGLASKPNLEANLVYLVDQSRQPESRRELSFGLPDSRALPVGVELRWQPRSAEGEDQPQAEKLPLLTAFGWATYLRDPEERKAVVTLSFNSKPPAGWWLASEVDDQRRFYEEKAWRLIGSPKQVTLAWNEVRPPSGFWVRWAGADGLAWWPVNVASSASLPPPEELEDLSMEKLIGILTSARPLHRQLGRSRDKAQEGASEGLASTDPHGRVDTSTYLLQRARRFSSALTALKHRLELPVVSRQGLEWRLRGPVGVEALVKAVRKEAKESPEEQAFLLCELALVLATVSPRTAPGCLPAHEIKDELKALVRRLKAGMDLSGLKANPELREYVDLVFRGVRA